MQGAGMKKFRKFTDYLRKDMERWAKLVKMTNIKVD
jgi:hypothetical protein